MKVYYNGSCNICNAEINQYKKNNQNIDYIDISKFSDSDICHLDKNYKNHILVLLNHQNPAIREKSIHANNF